MACRISNTIVTLFNIILLLLSLAAIVWSIYLFLYSNTACQRTMQYPLLIVGIVLFVMSLLGAIGSCAALNFFLYLYLFFMFVTIVGLICITIFVFLITNEKAGDTLSDKGFGRIRSGDYSNYIHNHFINGHKWEEMKSCLLDTHVCSNLGGNYQNVDEFNKKKLSLVQSGCCKPPSNCGFEFTNATYWTMPKTGPAVRDPDCTAWSNDQKVLCFNCKACKEGFIANIKEEWKYLVIFNICATVLLIVVYGFGCFATKNNRRDVRYRYMA